MSLQFPIAGIGSRFLAMLIDTLIQGAVFIVLLLITFLLQTFVGASGSTWLVAFLVAGVFLIYYAYFVLFEVAWNGQTPGKRMIGIRAIKESGRPLSTTETIGRNLMRIVDQLPIAYLLGVIVALCNSQNKRLGDYVAGSIMVRESELRDIKPSWQAETHLEGTDVTGITPEDLALIDTFLARRDSLAPDVRRRMAVQIVERLSPRLATSPAVGTDIEDFLAALAYERRSLGQS